MCSVDKTGCEAIITQRALVFLSAVASRFRSCGGSAENFVVMLLNDAFHVIHTAVANFNCVFVENFVVPMVFIYIYISHYGDSRLGTLYNSMYIPIYKCPLFLAYCLWSVSVQMNFHKFSNLSTLFDFIFLI